MTDPKRALVSFVFVASMTATLVLAFIDFSEILLIICITVQFCSLVWYVLSYIPYGRRMCSICLKACCCSKSSDEKTLPIV
jgi:hypothetical protein